MSTPNITPPPPPGRLGNASIIDQGICWGFVGDAEVVIPGHFMSACSRPVEHLLLELDSEEGSSETAFLASSTMAT